VFVATLLGGQNAFAVVFINEFLADPPSGLAGDSNLDGVRNSSQDEFIELLNIGDGSTDVSFWTLSDSVSLRHEFASGTLIGPHERFVVFGGGNLNSFPHPATIASTGSLGLNNSGDEITLKNALDNVVDSVLYGVEGGQNQSLTRFPEGTGAFEQHSVVSSQTLLFSPGTDPEGNTAPSIPVTPEPFTELLMGLGLLMAWFVKQTKFVRLM